MRQYIGHQIQITFVDDAVSRPPIQGRLSPWVWEISPNWNPIEAVSSCLQWMPWLTDSATLAHAIMRVAVREHNVAEAPRRESATAMKQDGSQKTASRDAIVQQKPQQLQRGQCLDSAHASRSSSRDEQSAQTTIGALVFQTPGRGRTVQIVFPCVWTVGKGVLVP